MTLAYRPARIDSTWDAAWSPDHTRPALRVALTARICAAVGLLCSLLPHFGCHPAESLGPAPSSVAIGATPSSAKATGLTSAPSLLTLPQPSVELVLEGESLPLPPERQSFWLAAHLRTPPGAHVYWRNPGSTGLPTRARFRGPEGLSFGEVRYPVPERFTGPGGSVGYGYRERTALLVEVHLTEFSKRQLENGASFTVEASWLSCAEVCTRESGEATLRVQSPRRESSTHLPISHYLEQLPIEASALGVFARRLDGHRISIAGPFEVEWLAYFPEHPLMPDHVDVTWKRGPAGELIVTGVPPGDHTAVVSFRSEEKHHHVRVPIPDADAPEP